MGQGKRSRQADSTSEGRTSPMDRDEGRETPKGANTGKRNRRRDRRNEGKRGREERGGTQTAPAGEQTKETRDAMREEGERRKRGKGREDWEKPRTQGEEWQEKHRQ